MPKKIPKITKQETQYALNAENIYKVPETDGLVLQMINEA